MSGGFPWRVIKAPAGQIIQIGEDTQSFLTMGQTHSAAWSPS